MSTTPEQINLWRSAASEHQRLEFKEAKTQFDFRTLCKYCVALANEGGGQLLFGIADKPPRPVVGTSAVNDPIGMAEKLFQTLGFRVDVEAVIRACYQHCCLCYVLHGKMTNQSLRERFRLPEAKAESASRVIRDAVEAGKIRLVDATQPSLRYRSYIPFWG